MNLSPRRILLIKPSALGDVVHALPVLGLLRRRWPTAHIAWMVNTAFAGIVEGHPQLDRVIRFDRQKMSAATAGAQAAAGLLELLRDLSDERFDLVIDLQGLLRSALCTAATLAGVRVGFAAARELAPLAYTHRVATRGPERHAVERYLDVAELLGCGREPVEFVFPVADSHRRSVGQKLGDVGRIAVLLPGTNWQTKRWPVEHFADLASTLRGRGFTPVIAGALDAAELADRLMPAVNLAQRTSLPELVALLERADLVVTNDSGPMHIAAALRRPMVSLFGPTSPVRTGPYGGQGGVVRLDILCSPCFSRRCSHASCMRWLTPQRVLDALEGR